MQILEDDLTGAEIAEFLGAHLDNMYAITPPESVHALDLDSLRGSDITFWSVWEGDALVGCGALKELDSANGEIKSMRTDEACRGRGIGSRIVEHIVGEARRRGYRALFLETGSMEEFAPARSLYERYGFSYCAPFGEYTEDANSVFMMKRIDEGDSD